MSTMKTALFAAAAMVAMAPLSANAHMIMDSPVPFNTPNNSPLAPDGSDFPCKGPPSASAKVNQWQAGSQQSLSFKGTAVHGGGSCQISVTNDKIPTKDSKWKVIYSIEGGCPADVPGNLDVNGPNSQTTFPFTVPKDLPNGEMTVAWTWFNKVGNREFYMNCASVSVTGGAKSTAAMDALPDMAIANIDVPGSCGTTKEMVDYTFQNPGAMKKTVGQGPFVDLCSGAPSKVDAGGGGGSGGNAGGGSNGNGSGNGNAGSGTNTGASPQAPAAPSPAQSGLRTMKTVTASMAPLPVNTGGIFAPSASGAPPAPAPTPTAKSSSSSTRPAVTPIPQTPSAASAASAAPVSDALGTTPCPKDGDVVCSSDGTKFGLCNFGKAVMMPVAAGTKCVNGKVARRSEYSHRNQRSAIF